MEMEENYYNVIQFFELLQATLQKSYYNLSSKLLLMFYQLTIPLSSPSILLKTEKLEINLSYC